MTTLRERWLRHRKNLRRAVVNRLLVWLALAFARLPLRLLAPLGERMGILAFWLCQRERRRTLEHLVLVYGDCTTPQARQAMARKVWAHVGRAAAEIIHLQWPDKLFRNLSITVEDQTQQRIDAVRSSGRGVLVLTAHLGNWELLGAYAVRIGIPIHVIVKPLVEAAYDGLIRRLRERAGLRMYYARGRDAVEMMRCLRRGDWLGVLIDQQMGEGDVVVPFFGFPAPTAPGFAELAWRTGALVVPAALLRTGPWTYRLEFGPVLEPPPGLTGMRLGAWYLKAGTEAVERLIRLAPEQWMWMTRRWSKHAFRTAAPQSRANTACDAGTGPGP